MGIRTDDKFEPLPADRRGYQKVYIDAGITRISIEWCDADNRTLTRRQLPNYDNLTSLLQRFGLTEFPTDNSEPVIYLTGSLQREVKRIVGRGKLIQSAAAHWSAASEWSNGSATAIVDISASGYSVIGVDGSGHLLDDMFAVNPRCGSGSGVNLDRILMKLNIGPTEVDNVLADYIGEAGNERRQALSVRADRCGVFASSATISDKNQGISIDFALATTLKSEVVKACSALRGNFDQVFLSGGVFLWQFARECAIDYLCQDRPVTIKHQQQNPAVAGMKRLDRLIGYDDITQGEATLLPSPSLLELPSIDKIKNELLSGNLFHRIGGPPQQVAATINEPVWIGLDVGSTMAKVVIADASGANTLFQRSYSNAGDTIETVKQVFADLIGRGNRELEILGLGITGSARYQVEKSIISTYPKLDGYTHLLVENYAHALGSLPLAKEHIQRLKSQGIESVNEEFCLLIDIGGEDTKITSISLERDELFDNAMNIKCSAGTGSLIDTVVSLFNLPDVAEAARSALHADRGYAINALCAIFLLESARKLQAQGIPTDHILASAHWAIVENMSRSLWSQIEIPDNAVVLLHGQPMLSDPLPVIVAHRLQEHQRGAAYCLVPPAPGHRACLGLIRQMTRNKPQLPVKVDLSDYYETVYSRKIIQCRGVACGDKESVCNRSHVSTIDQRGDNLSFALGGCSPINELQSGNKNRTKRVDSYRDILRFIDNQLPRSEDKSRLIIPRAFVLSEWGHLFSQLFLPFGIPVHIDNVTEQDIHTGRRHFHIDSCAPHIGAVGQIVRLAGEPHRTILLPQIEFLPVDGGSLGRSCTINQGGLAVARGLALKAHPRSNVRLLHLDLRSSDPEIIAHKLYPRLEAVYREHGVEIDFSLFKETVANAFKVQIDKRDEIASFTADILRSMHRDKVPVALILGREYVLNPGVYDSHIGRLLGDKGIAGIPAFLLDVEADKQFNHLYWRNAHVFATVTDAAVKGKVHQATKHSVLKEALQQIEGDGKLPIVQVSTFQCGPDSVTTPLLEELSKNRPFLKIQSDAALKELAHLENRVSTYLRQLDLGLHEELGAEKDDFDIRVLDSLSNIGVLSTEHDVIACPVIADNRLFLSVIKGAGFVTIDNYDHDFRLEETIERGRRVTGDTVCAPLAGIYGDVLLARERFKKLKQQGHPHYVNKKRLLFINNKGMGPCRQGQYVEAHKLLFANQCKGTDANNGTVTDDFVMQFLVGSENRGLNVGLPGWVYVRAVQSIILQGVLHQLLADGSSECKSVVEYKKFMQDYERIITELCIDFEARLRPSRSGQRLVSRFGSLPILGWIVKYYGYRFHDKKQLHRLQVFAKKWCHRNDHSLSQAAERELPRIHVDGETYMRVAQFEEILKQLLGTMGFRQFKLSYTPGWTYLEYKIAGMLMRAEESIEEGKGELGRSNSEKYILQVRAFVRKKRRRLLGLKVVHSLFRTLIVAPFYRAAAIPMPEPMPDILKESKAVIPTGRPGGELTPYVGETRLKLKKGTDLVFNVAPEGCMVSSMGEVITPAILASIQRENKSVDGKVAPLFSQSGDIDQEVISTALLKTLGPERFYRPVGKTT